jgi:hypothetical protein
MEVKQVEVLKDRYHTNRDWSPDAYHMYHGDTWVEVEKIIDLAEEEVDEYSSGRDRYM